jgi:hypothetical protein
VPLVFDLCAVGCAALSVLCSNINTPLRSLLSCCGTVNMHEEVDAATTHHVAAMVECCSGGRDTAFGDFGRVRHADGPLRRGGLVWVPL